MKHEISKAELLIQKQELPLRAKIILTESAIQEFYEAMNGKVYVSFSGGKDSTVLLNIVRRLYPKTPAVFSDTGLEYPEIKEFVKSVPGVTIIRPRMSFKQVIEKYGYPVISKEQALYIRQYRSTKSDYLKDVRWNGKNGRFKISEKWKFLVDAPFKISEQCCNVLKKNPMKHFRKETGLSPFIGNMATDSVSRKRIYIRRGCNSFTDGKESSTPLGFWTEDDIWKYIRRRRLRYSNIYNRGIDRTGCIFCLFGIPLEGQSRFEILKKLHPKLYDYCMNELGIKEVIKFINEGLND